MQWLLTFQLHGSFSQREQTTILYNPGGSGHNFAGGDKTTPPGQNYAVAA
jgi:hypothetical protein